MAVCSEAAKSVENFIAAALEGNMDGGPASYATQKARWESLSEECLATINAHR
jgi:hypothetical protein